MSAIGKTPDFSFLEVRSLGVHVTPLNVDSVCDALLGNIGSNTPLLMFSQNLHSVYLWHTDPTFQRLQEHADLIRIDGWPVLALLNRERSQRGEQRFNSQFRIGSTDWIPSAFELDEIEKIAVIGASPQSNSDFITRMSRQFPSKTFLGIPADPWKPEGLGELAQRLLTFKPQLTLVGMGMPLQEKMATQLKQRGVTGVLATVGGAIDQFSGAQSLAPRWTGRFKIEWLWRLLSNPQRLFGRYVWEPFRLVKILGWEIFTRP